MQSWIILKSSNHSRKISDTNSLTMPPPSASMASKSFKPMFSFFYFSDSVLVVELLGHSVIAGIFFSPACSSRTMWTGINSHIIIVKSGIIYLIGSAHLGCLRISPNERPPILLVASIKLANVLSVDHDGSVEARVQAML